jgi:hypothetical protein
LFDGGTEGETVFAGSETGGVFASFPCVAASYILEHDNPIEDGETIDGVADGQMCREIQWKCQYEDALIQPPRGVLDINMGNYASGGR